MVWGCYKSRRLLRRAYVRRRLEQHHLGWLWRHLRSCESCRGRYDRMMAMARLIEDAGALEGGATASLQIDLLKEWVAVRATTVPPEAEDCSGPPNDASVISRWLAMGLGGAVATALVAVVLLQIPEYDADGWQSRGSRTNHLAIKVFCEAMTPSGRPSLVGVSETPSSTEVGRCPEVGLLQFAYLSDRRGYLYVFTKTQTHAEDHLLRAVLNEPLELIATKKLKALPLQIPHDHAAGQDQVRFVFVRSTTHHTIDAVRKDVINADTDSLFVLERLIPLGSP